MAKLSDHASVHRGPGRPPSYVFDKPDAQLSDLERRLKLAVMKRRLRQNRNYHRRKHQLIQREKHPQSLTFRAGHRPPQNHDQGQDNDHDKNHPPKPPAATASAAAPATAVAVAAPSNHNLKSHPSILPAWNNHDQSLSPHQTTTPHQNNIPRTLRSNTHNASQPQLPSSAAAPSYPSLHPDFENTPTFTPPNISAHTQSQNHHASSASPPEPQFLSHVSTTSIPTAPDTPNTFLSHVQAFQYPVSSQINTPSADQASVPVIINNGLHRNGLTTNTTAEVALDPPAQHPAPGLESSVHIPDFQFDDTPFFSEIGNEHLLPEFHANRALTDPFRDVNDETLEMLSVAFPEAADLTDPSHALAEELPLQSTNLFDEEYSASLSFCKEIIGDAQADSLDFASTLLEAENDRNNVSEDTTNYPLTEDEILVEELLNIQTQSSFTASTAMVRMGALSVASSLTALPRTALSAACALSIFHDSFDQQAALAMIGQVGADMELTVLKPLFDQNLLSVVDTSGATARFALNPLFRQLIPHVASGFTVGIDSLKHCNSDDTLALSSLSVGAGLDSKCFPSRHMLEQRYVAYYGKVLSDLSDTPSLNVHGSDRFKAMRFFDAERKNVEHAMTLAQSLGNKIEIDFLRKSAAVMRYCTDAKTRARVFQSALDGMPYPDARTDFNFPLLDDFLAQHPISDLDRQFPGSSSITGMLSNVGINELSAEGVTHYDLMHGQPTFPGEDHAPDSSFAEANDECTWWNNTARIHLALGEAYFDMLDITKAVQPLEKAMELLDVRERRPQCAIKTTSLVLGNLLLAEIRAIHGETSIAKQLLHYALSLLSGIGLQESTYTVNAMNTLVNVQIRNGDYDEAMRVCTRMVDILSALGYSELPIYADALGTMAVVHLNMKQLEEAERVFSKALEVIHTWIDKMSWRKGVPYEHCQDLDIWLLEGLANVYDAQGFVTKAVDTRDIAMRRRTQRGLSHVGFLFDERNNANGLQVNADYASHDTSLLELEGFRTGVDSYLHIPESITETEDMPPRVLWSRQALTERLSYPRHGY